MAAQLTLDDQLFQDLLAAGELKVDETHGMPIVLMTVDARQRLEKAAYDAGDWSRDEMLSVAANALDDPEGWGAPKMDEYDEQYGHLFDTDGENQ